MTDITKRRMRRRVSNKRQQASEHSEDDGIKTITYDEYVNAGIPDALLQGLGFAESLSQSQEPSEMDELNNDVSVPAKETDAPSVESSSADIQSGSPSVVASDVPQSVIPVSLIQLLSSHVGNQALSVMSGNSSLSCTAASIYPTPTALSLIDLPMFAPVTSSAGSTAARDDRKASSHAVTYVDQNGRVLRSVALPASSRSAGVRLVDSNGRIVQPSTASVDKNGRVLGISKANADSESKAGNSQVSLSTGAVTTSDMKPPEPRMTRKSVEQCNRPQKTSRVDGGRSVPAPARRLAAVSTRKDRDVVITRFPGNRQTGPLPNHSATGVGRGTDTRTTTRTKGQVRYDRLPTGEVVASIIREAASTNAAAPATPAAESGVWRGQGVSVDTSSSLPEDYPVNQSNVTAVVEEAHRATQSMRILLTSMREELRRAGGLSVETGSWTVAQLNQRRNICQRLDVAYQSYKKSINDIENLRFHGAAVADDSNSRTGNSGRELKPTANVPLIVLPSSSCRISTRRTVMRPRRSATNARGGHSSEQVVDLTD